MNNDLPSSESLFKDKNNQRNLEQARDLRIMFEYEKLADCTPQGMFIIPNIKTIHIWHGIIFIRSGVYQGAVFRFVIDIPFNYPLVSPTVHFVSSVFHPLIDFETGELNLQPKFPS